MTTTYHLACLVTHQPKLFGVDHYQAEQIRHYFKRNCGITLRVSRFGANSYCIYKL